MRILAGPSGPGVTVASRPGTTVVNRRSSSVGTHGCVPSLFVRVPPLPCPVSSLCRKISTGPGAPRARYGEGNCGVALRYRSLIPEVDEGA